MPFTIGIILKMKNSLFFVIALCVVGCTSTNSHNKPHGNVNAVIPAPSNIELALDSTGASTVGFFSDGNIYVDGFKNLSGSYDLVKAWFESAGLKVEEGGVHKPNLYFELVDAIPGMFEGDEDYGISVGNDEIRIIASHETGLFRGWTTLRLMMPSSAESGGCANGFFLPQVEIYDTPEFEHRGLLLDCCRHFMEPEFVKKQIDILALHKMNVLHWHLTEDQGWRIEIDAYPLLTEVGAWRTELDGSTHGGFYTKETIREIIEYAAERHVEIIPEIEIPGHSQAALAAYPWLGCTGEHLPVANKWGVFKDIYCAGNDQTLEFLETVLDEVCELFPSNRIHIGGDEAPKVRWAACPKCQTRITSEHLADEHELQTWIRARERLL